MNTGWIKRRLQPRRRTNKAAEPEAKARRAVTLNQIATVIDACRRVLEMPPRLTKDQTRQSSGRQLLMRSLICLRVRFCSRAS